MALHTIEICAGVGMLGEGLRAGLDHLGIPLRTVCYVEREAYAAAVLAARCEEGSLDPAPIWSDLLTFGARRWAGAVDGIVAGFPCQDLSLAGRRAGLDGKRSGLFFNILDIADACGAWFLFLENVAGIASATASVMDEAEGALEERAAARVLGELAERGWHAEWLTLSASEVGASHGRERWFCFAWRREMDYATSARCNGAREWSAADGEGRECMLGKGCEALGNTQCTRRQASGCGHAQHARGELESGCLSLGNTGLQHQHLQQRPEGAEHQGASGELAHAERKCCQRRGEPGDVACTGGSLEGKARERQWCGPAIDGCSQPVANPGSPGCQRRELGRALHGNRGGGESIWTN